MKGTVKGAAWCLPEIGKGHSLYEFSTTTEFINGKVTFFLAKPKNMVLSTWENCLRYNLRECLPPDKDINRRETGLNY